MKNDKLDAGWKVGTCKGAGKGEEVGLATDALEADRQTGRGTHAYRHTRSRLTMWPASLMVKKVKSLVGAPVTL